MIVCANGRHARFVLNLCPRVAPTNAPAFVGVGLEWNRVLSPKFVQRGCTVTTNRIRVGEMLLREARRRGEGYRATSLCIRLHSDANRIPSGPGRRPFLS